MPTTPARLRRIARVDVDHPANGPRCLFTDQTPKQTHPGIEQRPIQARLGRHIAPGLLTTPLALRVIAHPQRFERDDIGRSLCATGVTPIVCAGSIETLARAMSAGGIIILYGSLSGEPTPFPFRPAMQKRLTVRAYTLFEVAADPERFAAGKRFIIDGLASGRLTPIVAKVFALSEIVAAHTYLESNQQAGKVVVSVD